MRIARQIAETCLFRSAFFEWDCFLCLKRVQYLRTLVKVTPFRIFSLKLAFFSAVLAYLAVDLLVWHGPVWGALHSRRANALSQDAVAKVYGELVSCEALERLEQEQNWLRGRTETPKEEQAAMLMELVRRTLLGIRTRYNDKNLPDYTEEARTELSRLESRAVSAQEFDSWLASQGYTRQSFEQRLAMAMKSAALLERAAEQHCAVSDADVDKHYELLRGQLSIPAHRQVKQIFLATLEKNPQAVETHARNLLTQAQKGEDFARLARNNSEDDATAANGGDLGEVYDTPDRTLPELPLFGEQALPAGKLALVQSRWGWHILLPGEITPARVPGAGECRESLKTAIRSAQRELAVQAYYEAAIREAFSNEHLQIYGRRND